MIGTAPFIGKNVNEILSKNKECNIAFDSSLWTQISSEGLDLVKRMLDPNPATRITAKEALSHAWFTLEHISNSMLTIAQENMKKYCSEKVFNVEKIKPNFSMVTCSPLLGSRGAGLKDSPLIFSRFSTKEISRQIGGFATERGSHDKPQQEESKFQVIISLAY